ncbi:unnamed protein product [Symbiodinium natans]|uniref:Uncharacterized protein n=1 Tax=Symbiodinium natans TaxID=878477 RepID=A0A812PQY5_9DINO|nr:unnamed protein product [Symbiodinium natans]
MAWDFSVDVSKPRKGPTTPGFSGDWRGGAALHQAPQPSSQRRPAASGTVEEHDSDEEAPAVDAAENIDKSQVNLVWDSEKGRLVPAPAAGAAGAPGAQPDKSATPEAATTAPAAPAAEAPAEAPEDADEGEEEEDPAGDQEVDVEAESRAAFLSEASTPELIKQAVAAEHPADLP